MGSSAASLSLALVLGTAAGATFDVGAPVWRAVAVTAWMVAVGGYVMRRPGALAAAGISGCLAAGGFLADRAAQAALDPPVLTQTQAGVPGGCRPAAVDPSCIGGPIELEGTLRQDAERSPFGVSLTLDVTRVWLRHGPVPSGGGVRVTVGGAFAERAREEWRAGRTLRLTASLRRPQPYRNFGVPDEEQRTALRGVRLTGSVKSASLVQVVARGSALEEAAGRARAHVRAVIARTLGVRDEQAAAIVVAVLIGDRAGLSSELESRLQRAGTFHVIAISGGNIAVLVALALVFVRHVGLRPHAQAMAAMLAVASYALIVAAGSSVARATVAAILYLGARTLDHRASPRAVMGTTAVLLLLAWPLGVLDVGLWLTFVASLAIVEQASWIERHLAAICRIPDSVARLPLMRAVLLLLSGTLAAEAALAPVLAFVFGQVSVAGLVLNFAAVPLMTVVQLAGLASMALDAAHPTLASPAVWIALVAARGITESARAIDLVPWAAPYIAYPATWLVALVLAAWWGAWSLPARSLRRAAAGAWIAGLLLVASGRTASWPLPWNRLPVRLATCAVPDPPYDQRAHAGWTRIVVMDVGQGDATMVRWPTGRVMLVDGGGSTAGSRFDVGARVVAPALWALGVRSLDVAVLTHGDADHSGGMPALVERFDPREVWEGLSVRGHPPLERLADVARARGVSWRNVREGDAEEHGEAGVRVWHPRQGADDRGRVHNDDSVVLEVRHGLVSVVLPGDIGPGVEAELARLVPPSALRIVKASHHGSRTSSTAGWLDALAPRAALVSAGRDNRHGHPAPASLERMATRAVDVFRTDRDGAIAIDTDGTTVRLRTCGGRDLTYQIRSAPGRPLSTLKLATVETGASGRVTNGTMR